MKNKIFFTLGFHNHQPIGNFDFVIEKAYNLAYKPLINFFLKNPDFPFSIHFSGFLLQWLENKHPEYFKNLKILSERGQMEIFSGGFYEPILPIIPDEDKVLQIKKLNKYIWNKFGQKPKGMWLAERVWEPHLVKFLAESEIEYTVLDDTHFLSTGLNPERLFNYFIIEEQGYMIKVFPINMKLRYLIPFHEPLETIEYLKSCLKGEINIVVLFDDGEKFGLWPDTYKTVYEERWLERFLEILKENSHWIKLMNFRDYDEKNFLPERIYLPTASYREMMEWSLYTSAQKDLENLINDIKNIEKWEKYSSFIRGGFWRNFLVKYPEANHIHKRMLYVRKKIESMAEKSKYKNFALEEIWKAQANDAYWHGIFGGLYLPHLRSTIYSHIIKAENYLEKMKNKNNIILKSFDFDCDGKEEIIVESKNFNLYFAPHLGAGLLEWDFKPLSFNLTDILTRREEAYHEKLHLIKENEGKGRTIHERWAVKEKGLENILFYDRHRRISFKEYFLKNFPSVEELWKCEDKPWFYSLDFSFNWTYKKTKKNFLLLFSGENNYVKLEKIFMIYEDKHELGLIYKIKNISSEKTSFVFGWEVLFNFLAPEHDEYYFYIPETSWKSSLRSMGIEETDNWGIKSPFIDLTCRLKDKAKWYRYPIETVSLSEEGFERVYQGSALLHFYNIKLEPNEDWDTEIVFHIDVNPNFNVSNNSS
ncbi:MAG: alpha-amylase/4-alpha-glucanotransferase domain-containing protein [Dictyoglomaceae bacterium]